MVELSARMNRAAFLQRIGGLFAVAIMGGDARLRSAPQRSTSETHPEPRPGINADHVLKGADLEPWAKDKDVLPAYDAARAYPAIFDGLACACGCYGTHGEHRSLLACYETKQPTGCAGCRKVAMFVGSLAKQRKPLDEIRSAYDKEF